MYNFPFIVFSNSIGPVKLLIQLYHLGWSGILALRTRRAITTCTLPIDPPNASVSPITNDHKSLCLSLAEQLIHRGFLSANNSTFFETGVSLLQLAEALFRDSVVSRGFLENAEDRFKYCREGKVDCALMLLNNMLSCNLASNVHCYKVLVNALYKENRLLEVYDLFKSVLAIAKNGCGFDPSMLSSSAGVNSNGDLEQEIEILLEGIVRCNFNLANVAFSVIVSALCGEGKPNDALLYMDKIGRMDVGCL
nr:pentatricopeptide repeat-containing protein [Quercus suber]